jgi:hypothetical protein
MLHSTEYDVFLLSSMNFWAESARRSVMTGRRRALFALSILSLTAAAWATETITYSYDARGRLVKVVRTGDVNNNVSADYKYDKGDNRTNVNVVSPD